VSTHARSVFIFIALAGSLRAQSFSGHDASGELYTNSLGPTQIGGSVAGEPGTISVRELQHPLEGKGLQIIMKAKDLLARGDSAQAIEQLRVALREPAAEPYALAMLGVEHLKRGDFDTALHELQAAVHLSPGLPASQSNLAYALAVKGRNEEALAAARKALQLDPGRPRTRYVLGQILMQMGRWNEAEFHLRRAAEEVSSARMLLAKYFTHATPSH
jgi:Flp pilus assembly protein TadD